MKSSRKLVVAVFVALLASTALLAQDIPLRNWTVPPFDASMFIKPSGPSIRPLTHDQGNTPAVFVPFGPCRLFDSRILSGGPGPVGGVGVGGERTHDFVTDGCNTPGIGFTSDPIIAWSINVTVTGTLGPGFIYFYPTGGAPPPVATMNYTGAAGELRNNAAIVVVNPATGSFTIGAGVNGTDYILDVNGIFLFDLENTTQFKIIANIAGQGAIVGQNDSSANGSHGIGGFANGTGIIHGVQGFASASAAAGSSGVHGIGSTASGTYGVLGQNFFLGGGSGAGVRGKSGDNAAIAAAESWSHAGVKGSGTVWGVLGFSDNIGAGGFHHNPVGGALQTGSYLGISSTNGLYTIGDTSASGVKGFVDPHPTDASKLIRYISLEGPEAGTYFRGRARFQNGVARIQVPEDFRLVTDADGLTVQITPIGAMATVAVLGMDLNEIVVQASRNVEFSYLVQGVRRTFKDAGPILENEEYRPFSTDFRMPEGYSPEQKRLLIQNGTYKPDGSVNMETAQRLGWDKIWEKRNPPAPAPNPE